MDNLWLRPPSRESTPGTPSIGKWTRPPSSADPSDGEAYGDMAKRRGVLGKERQRSPFGIEDIRTPTSSSATEMEEIFAFHPPTTAEQLNARFGSAYPSSRALPHSVPSDPSPDSQKDFFGQPTAGPSNANTESAYINRQIRDNSSSNSNVVILPPSSEAVHFQAVPEEVLTEEQLGRAFRDSVLLRDSVAFTDVSNTKKRGDRGSNVPRFDFDDLYSQEDLKEYSISVEEPEPEDSPFPEVQASVSNKDDPDMPVSTFRMWTVGLFLCCVSAGLNTFFNFRYPAPSVTPLVLILLAHPSGKFLAYALPVRVFRISFRGKTYEFSFNPGPWNIKEHACVYLMANVSVTFPYAMNTIVVSEIYYNIRLGLSFNLTLILATQLTGFGLAGLARRHLVWPASMVWPQNLVACSLLNTLHAEDERKGTGITRYKFFMIAVAAAFFYYFLPGFLFQALSMFSYMCWIFPKNRVVNDLFGVRSGLGLGVLTFDWSQISFIGSPLMVPWWAQVHVMAGFVCFYWIIGPILYYNNVWKLGQFPMSANTPFDQSGNPYNVSRITSGKHRMFNATAYEDYSPLYLPMSYALSYLLQFALATCLITHTVLYHGKSIVQKVLRPDPRDDDIHAKLMKHYVEVPTCWYAFCWMFFLSLAILAVKVWATTVPVWALLLAVALAVIYILPAGFVYAMTGQVFCLNLIGEVVPGVLLPGNPVANMIFKAYSVQTLAEALSFVQDLKLGHYMKIPPRTTFIAQLVATIVASFVQVGVKEWLFSNVQDLCTQNQQDLFSCPQNQVYFAASAIWGVIGPARQIGMNAVYGPEAYALAFGALIPLPFWLWRRWFPHVALPIFNTPVFFNGPTQIPPATGINYSSWFVVGLVFQYLVRRKRFNWWSKFNYILSAALDSGTVLSICAVFFFLQFPRGGITLNWSGNTIFKHTRDWESVVAPDLS